MGYEGQGCLNRAHLSTLSCSYWILFVSLSHSCNRDLIEGSTRSVSIPLTLLVLHSVCNGGAGHVGCLVILLLYDPTQQVFVPFPSETTLHPPVFLSWPTNSLRVPTQILPPHTTFSGSPGSWLFLRAPLAILWVFFSQNLSYCFIIVDLPDSTVELLSLQDSNGI